MKKSLEEVKKYVSSAYTKEGRVEKLKSEEKFKFGLFNCAACQFSNNTTAIYYIVYFMKWNYN